jgi:hypothetical protein
MPVQILIAIGVEVTATSIFIANVIISTAASFVVSKMFGPDTNQDKQGARQQLPPSARNSIPIVYGDAYLSGNFVDAVLTTDQKTMYYVMAISHISPDGQFTYDTTDFWYGDKKIAFDSTDQTQVISLKDQAGNVDTKIIYNMYIYLYTSTVAGAISPINTTLSPDVVMGGTDIASGLRWASTNRQMNGLAFAIIKMNYNQDAGTTALQRLLFKVSHNLKSTGAAKPGDVLYDYLTNTKYGAAVDAAEVNSTACNDLNTYSDDLITYTPSGGGSATQPRYRINGVLDTTQPVLENINQIVTACDCWFAYEATTGQWKPIINSDVGLGEGFDDTNIIGPIRVSMSDLSATINQIEVEFPFKENRDQASYVYLATPAGSLYVNEPVNKLNTKFELVNDSVQATYLANRILKQAREDINISFDTAYTGIQTNVGDIIYVTNIDYGWNPFKFFRVMKVSEVALPDGNLGARIEASEYSQAVYDDISITAYAPIGNSLAPSFSYFSALTAPTVGDQLPSNTPATFSVSCTMPTTGQVMSVTLFYTTSATPSPSDWQVWTTQTNPDSSPFANGSVVKFSNIIVPIGTYYFSFQVANLVGTSIKSPSSTALNWQPGSTAGVVASFDGSASTFSSGTATAVVRFASNGTIQTSLNGGAYTTVGNWYLPTTTNIGSTPGYWLYVTATTTAGAGLTSGTTGSWIKLDTNRDYTVTRSTLGYNAASMTYQISSSSTGTPVVGYGTGIIDAERI